ncbi:MAG: flagellar biosynthesis protein FlhB [Spirochaetota bacterium]
MKYEELAFPFIHLQWFAAEDEGRTEEPSEHKLKKAREEGKVAKSAEFTSALVMLFCVITIGILSSYMLGTMIEMIRFFFRISNETDIAAESRLVPAFYNYFIKLTLPLAAIAFISAVLGNVFQVGFLFTVKPIVPDLKRIAPKFIKFFKRALFSGEAAFNLAKSVLKIVVVVAITFINIQGEIDKMVHFVTSPFWMSISSVAVVAFRILFEASIAMLVLSLPDYLFQRRQHREALKMTKQEVKEERKMLEGDPLVQSRLRQRMRELLSQNMLRNVPRADVVITNPTHFAVAMEWNRLTMIAPMVIAKGQDNLAFKMKEIAKANNVPIIENKPLARALYDEIEVGDVIPEKYYEVMALVLAEVYKLTGRTAEAV